MQPAVNQSQSTAPELAALLLGVADGATRAESLQHLCAWLGCESLLLFVLDPDLGIPIPAPGFPQTLQQGREWRTFVQVCRHTGTHRGVIAFPDAATPRAVNGLTLSDGSVLAFIGGHPLPERSQALAAWTPLLAMLLKASRLADIATQRATFERQATAQSQSLAERLDAVARENDRLFHESQKNLAERRRVEADQQRFVALVENSADCIGLFAPGGEVLFLNRSGLQMTGLDNLEAARTRRFEDLFHDAHRALARERIIPQVLETGRWTGETQFVNSSTGSAIDVHQTTFLITQARDLEPMLAMIARDITEAKRADERLRHTAKLESLGVMAGGIAHDFNNLLTGIMGNASLLVTLLPPADVALAEEIVKTSERAAHLTHQMLAYAGQGRFQLAPLDLSHEVREVLTVVKSSIDAHVTLQLNLPAGLPLIQADPGQMQQVIMNLVINASEALNGKPGSITLETRLQEVDAAYTAQTFGPHALEPGHYISLEVHDTGEGMSEDTQAKIFDPFFTTKFTGRGLGLAAVSGIIRGHKGALKVYSAPGRGTTFKIIFPALAVEAAPPPTVAWRDLTGSGTILVIDDEDMVRKVAKAVLEGKGYHVLLAEDGQAGVELFARVHRQIALVLLDLTMPRMGGEEALTRLRAIRPDVPVILSSGYNEAEILRRFTVQPVAGFVQKPYTATRILSKIQEVLQSHSDIAGVGVE